MSRYFKTNVQQWKHLENGACIQRHIFANIKITQLIATNQFMAQNWEILEIYVGYKNSKPLGKKDLKAQFSHDDYLDT